MADQQNNFQPPDAPKLALPEQASPSARSSTLSPGLPPLEEPMVLPKTRPPKLSALVLLFFLFILAGTVSAIYLIKQRTLLEQKAEKSTATPTPTSQQKIIIYPNPIESSLLQFDCAEAAGQCWDGSQMVDCRNNFTHAVTAESPYLTIQTRDGLPYYRSIVRSQFLSGQTLHECCRAGSGDYYRTTPLGTARIGSTTTTSAGQVFTVPAGVNRIDGFRATAFSRFENPAGASFTWAFYEYSGNPSNPKGNLVFKRENQTMTAFTVFADLAIPVQPEKQYYLEFSHPDDGRSNPVVWLPLVYSQFDYQGPVEICPNPVNRAAIESQYPNTIRNGPYQGGFAIFEDSWACGGNPNNYCPLVGSAQVDADVAELTIWGSYVASPILTPTNTPTLILSPTGTPSPMSTAMPTSSPTPTSTVTPTPTTIYSISCSYVRVYNESWQQITNLSSLKTGQRVYLAVKGETNHPSGITKGKLRMKLNEVADEWQETVQKNDQSEFYILYVIPQTGNYEIEGMVYNPTLGWR